jgi:hypothetical protein
MSVDLGDTYRLSTRNLSAAGDLTTATNMALTITRPDDTTVVVNPVTASSTGIYNYDYLTTQAGRHLARWVATGTGAGAYVEAFDVLPADPAYLISLRDVKEVLNIEQSNTSFDEELRIYTESATRAAENHRDEILAKRSFVYETYCYGSTSVVLPRVPVVSLTSITSLNGSGIYTVGNYHVNRTTGKVTAVGGPSFTGLLAFTYVAGYTIVPSAFLLAVRLIVQHLWETQRGPVGASRFAGGLDDAALMRFRAMNIFVPPRAQELLGEPMPMV